ncbi:MAG: hypothetical protein JWN40_5479 [Phycisphaerales bacterium]|nr:hypothetical protein [Phycisphaerales bacterium]
MKMLIGLLVAMPTLVMAATPEVRVVRCPDGGVQPQAAVDSLGKVHLIYLKGEDGRSDVFYVTSADGGRTWGKALRVNSQAGAAIATGTVRGAHLAIGKGDRVHVAWMGSSVALPKAVGDGTPMLYARMNDAGDGFEAQRNLITAAAGLDGGGSVAADGAGNVYVAWHAPMPGMRGEENRRVWLAVSKDEGKRFAAETAMLTDATGACGCCGMRLGVDGDGRLMAIYRAANAETRDIYLLEPAAGGGGYSAAKVESFATKVCPMSTASFARSGERMLGAWETGGQVSFAAIDPRTKGFGTPVAAAGKGNNRKHPSLAINKDGEVLFAWDEGTAWKRGGTVHWQVYDRSLKPVAGAAGMERGLVAWSLPTAVATGDGGFLIVY